MKTSWVLLLVVAALTIAIVSSSDLFAQRRERGDHRERRPAVVVPERGARVRVMVGEREYFYGGGVFYRSGPSGYVAIRGPIGARIRTLPPGYSRVVIGTGTFFLYAGTYYRLDPVTREYVVVLPPTGSTAPPGMDQIQLVTGEMVNGVYAGGTKSIVQIQTGGTVREIPVDQIVSIVFAPPGP